ncbi:hypothetical protein [Deinococcus multiflagellatus]|uniref:hypothetical protein n=1 Tax=Deinococcus multiflagellatus TaxID=1656887 RepID=UPI001CCF4175|nr:hypothetical protein [Deinococcus multiflagellatus]MBZ9712272.1 hypothetical protein [Deinococcus multiflagellatus]
MQKTGLYALAGITLFALVFAFVPTGRRDAGTGVTLSGVELRLYPSRDPDAVWSFRAAKVDSDPLQNRTRLTGLSGGQRVVKEKDARGRYTGRMTLDARLTTPDLTIDGQDNMTTRQARITLVKECADIDLTGNEQTLVRIEGGRGFYAPVAKVRSPFLNGDYQKLQMGFDFNIEDVDNDNSVTYSDLDTTERCVNGQRVKA